MQKHKKEKRNEQSITDLWNDIRQSNVHAIVASKGEKKDRGWEKKFEITNWQLFQVCERLQICRQESQQTPNNGFFFHLFLLVWG